MTSKTKVFKIVFCEFTELFVLTKSFVGKTKNVNIFSKFFLLLTI